MWLFLVGVGLPVGSQAGRVLLAHLSTPAELSRYALMAQIYAVCWQVLSTAALGLLAVFVKRRAATEQTVRMWWRLTWHVRRGGGGRHAGPCAARTVGGHRAVGGTNRRITWLALAFGVLLVGQSVHLPASVLLTRPNEARWQALWAMAMAVISIGLGCMAAIRFGAVGVVYASALAIFAAQVLPDLVWVPRLVRRRPLAVG